MSKLEPTPDSLVKQNEMVNGTASLSPNKSGYSHLGASPTKVATSGLPSYLYAEKLVTVLVDLFLQTPSVEKYIMFPEIIQSLGRCMTTRRDNPDGGLWRFAVEGFNRIVLDDISKLAVDCVLDSKISKPARMRVWKEIADIYEIFLVGYCGRALPPNSLSLTALKADESLEMTIINILGDKILKSRIDAPSDILRRLISTLDRCASRTCFLPVETVELMPLHCSRFSLSCLQKLFSLSSADDEVSDWNSTRCKVSKISIVLLITRCENILNRYLYDENDLGEHPLPSARLEEIIFALQELARLIIHSDTVTILPLHSSLKFGHGEKEDHGSRSQLLVLFPSFCELVISREVRVRELVQVLLRLVAGELSLGRVRMAS